MILVDANLLIYAVDSDSPYHFRARSWLEDALSGGETVGFPWMVLLAFLRVTTRASILVRPLEPVAALKYVDSWLDQPNAEAVAPGRNHWPVLQGLLPATGTGGNLTSDAHVAALAVERGAVVYSADNDFKRFPGVEHVNPLA